MANRILALLLCMAVPGSSEAAFTDNAMVALAFGIYMTEWE